MKDTGRRADGAFPILLSPRPREGTHSKRPTAFRVRSKVVGTEIETAGATWRELPLFFSAERARRRGSGTGVAGNHGGRREEVDHGGWAGMKDRDSGASQRVSLFVELVELSKLC